MIPLGFQMAGVRCGLKNKRNDLGLILSDRPAIAAGVVTTNAVRAASVDYTRDVLRSGRLRAVVVNSGNANCCTGVQGVRDTVRMAELAAEGLGVDPREVAVASTGVIGQPLDMTKVEKGIRNASHKMGDDVKAFMDAILTTDLVEKWAWRAVEGEVASPSSGTVDPSKKGTILGLAKGSGMIAPNMATMLGYIVTDLDVEGLDLDAILRESADVSFNCMTVDGDTSTNDMLVLMANGASGVKVSCETFRAMLDDVCVSLAKQIARDGEGATKLVEVRVTGTENPTKVARTIAESPLVKTAMFGCDPNWGRVLMAAGRSGVALDPQQALLTFIAGGEGHILFERGTPTTIDPRRVSAAMKTDYLVVDLWLGEGPTATVYTCDLSYGYVRINAEYHT
ncbi:bifunctional glutamate N-acetyltransferase/amino-acid acetyltransferase ArgJ [bacterium]|nr:MAG: bifunctional glutamate N-acetyltransferase/amino-acid acetyltransferase ArgJ [bacterium]